jgi:hypothetical protein
MNTRVELLIAAISWLTVIGLIAAIIADALCGASSLKSRASQSRNRLLHPCTVPDVAVDADNESYPPRTRVANRCTFLAAENGWGRCLDRRPNDDAAWSVSASAAARRRAARAARAPGTADVAARSQAKHE